MLSRVTAKNVGDVFLRHTVQTGSDTLFSYTAAQNNNLFSVFSSLGINSCSGASQFRRLLIQF